MAVHWSLSAPIGHLAPEDGTKNDIIGAILLPALVFKCANRSLIPLS